VVGYKDALLAAREDSTTISRAFSGKTMRVLRNGYTRHFEDHPEELQPFPGQLGRSMQDGAWHLGGGGLTPGVDPDREGYPAGQDVGAISALEPALDLVRRIVAEAEQIAADMARFAGR
jgi:enoyl-[acyl-carrier protein] reductase II